MAIKNASTWTALAAVALTLMSLTLTIRRARQPRPRMIPSPRDTLLPHISPQQAAALPYPPDLLPGSRDVTTPYGVMRVYEWGPKDGDKVLFIHGDTTPAPMLGPIAHGLVDRGCRVLLFVYLVLTTAVVKDLWGRGYSDTPLDVPHDVRLYELQIFFATASSSLPWTGAESGGFSIVAFSLGGGIAMAFAANFYHLINSVTLLAPGGIIRRLPAEYKSVFFRCPSLLPSSYLRKLVGKVLGAKDSSLTIGFDGRHAQSHMTPKMSQEGEMVGQNFVDIPAIVQWQFDNHRGFVHSFVSTIQYGPIQYQHSEWGRVWDIIQGNIPRTPLSSHHCKLFNSKMLVIFGDADTIVLAKEVSADLLNFIDDPEHVEFKVVAGDHGFPVPKSEEVATLISDFCGLGSRYRSPK